jgi:hypothetical protein
MAKALGRRGGRARAAKLAAAERRRIAALGGVARQRSLEAARRVAENAAYVAAVDVLGGGPRKPRRARTCRGPLPGIYAGR